jgi:SAM-dependent methyltransferase
MSTWQPLIPGGTTATPLNVSYRVGRIKPYLSGRWLDYGCADGGYAEALLSHGVSEVVGVDVHESRIKEAASRGLPNAGFHVYNGSYLDFPDDSFDGAFVNEVLEHVADEQVSLREILRVLRPGGYLILISPNRWFPFEGHGATIGGRELEFPTPLIPWLPERLTRSWLRARNYWPRQLVGQARKAGFRIQEVGFIWPVFSQYRWMPKRAIALYQRYIERLDGVRGLRRFGVSTMVIGTKA